MRKKSNDLGGKCMKRKIVKKIVVIGAMIGVLSTNMSAFAAEDYLVKSGDYLKKIAKQAYGDEAKWELIYEANKGSIKNPNLIYKGQILTIPDVEQVSSQVIDETVPAFVTDTNIATETNTIPTNNVPADNNPALESDDSDTYKNVPVGINPVLESNGFYIYTFINGDQLTCTAQNYVAEVKDLYGITYREYRQGANEIMMQKVADFISQNPDSNFASMMTVHGGQFVIVSSCTGLWDDVNDCYWYYDIVDCEPDDCVYMFLAGNVFDDDCVDEFCIEMFNSVSDSISID